ncbi:RloB domain-containing protein [bacterium]|nr:RloB domain-containing protein [Bacteroidales bacterium]MCK5685138.1 RloB domain-containing protein [bacterium]
MARDRKKKSGKRHLKPRLFVLCEGTKTEPRYLKGFLKNLGMEEGYQIDIIELVDTEINTAKELVDLAIKQRELEKDEIWAVFDKDGYTMHAQAFDRARAKDINIAFSSISFETWILLHYVYTTKEFEKSEDVIKYMKDNGYIDYEKSDCENFNKTKDKLEKAIINAKRLRHHQKSVNSDNKIYKWNPYTNIDELLESIRTFIERHTQ